MSKTIINHPPVITIFIGRINHSQSWVVKMALVYPHESILIRSNSYYRLVIQQFAMERYTIFKNGKPSISMGHLLYHGYVSHKQMVIHVHPTLPVDLMLAHLPDNSSRFVPVTLTEFSTVEPDFPECLRPDECWITPVTCVCWIGLRVPHDGSMVLVD